MLTACNTVGPQATSSIPGARGATVAFDSIDGPPRDVFDRLVQELNSEAQSRHLAVVSRDGNAAYRVRGYLMAAGSPKHSAINWVWDVYDGRRQRVMRVAGEQTIAGKHRDAWAALDGPAVHKIARDSVDQLATFLTSPDALPSATTQIAYGDESSPEAAGIFRIIPVGAAPDAGETVDPEAAGDVPLPPRRSRLAAAGTVAMAAAPRD